METASPSYRGHRYPVEVISHCVWLHFRFPLSFREVEELMLQRGWIVSYETVRHWCRKLGQAYADRLRRRRPRPAGYMAPGRVFIKINGELKYLWRAVNQDGNVLDILVQNRRDKATARRFFRRLLKKTRVVPRVIVTDKLRSYGAAHHEVMPSAEHRSHEGLNNRAENSHQPARQSERAMKAFRNVGAAQRFLAAFSLRHDLRIELSVAVPRHRHRHHPGVGQNHLGRRAVAAVAQPRRIMLLVAQVAAHLGFQRPLQHRPPSPSRAAPEASARSINRSTASSASSSGSTAGFSLYSCPSDPEARIHSPRQPVTSRTYTIFQTQPHDRIPIQLRQRHGMQRLCAGDAGRLTWLGGSRLFP